MPTRCMGRLLQVLLAPTRLSACMRTDQAAFGNTADTFQPIASGYVQSCAVHKPQVSDCQVFRLEGLGPGTAMLWSPGEGRPSTVAYERIDAATHPVATHPAFHLRGLSEPEGRRMFEELAAKKK